MSYRLSSPAEAQLNDIWLYIARESGSVDTAIRIMQNISDRFWLLAKHPRMGDSVRICRQDWELYRWRSRHPLFH